MRIPSDEPAYVSLRSLFADDLERQGVGTFADICNGKRDAFLPVPYWAWCGREQDVAKILAKQSDRQSLRFVWPILRDLLEHCQCVISGAAVEIEPYIPPLEIFGSYAKARHRVFMSATVTDDAFLVKGLQLKPETIAKPLIYAKERWSGEKMVLLPALIHEELDRSWIIAAFAKASPSRKFGVVALTPSFLRSRDWEAYGSIVAKSNTMEQVINGLKDGSYQDTVVLANRYDGIDLPDHACRVLVFDGRPFSEHLVDLYQEGCRPNSAATLMRTIRTVEQGMGRSVRGEKDYSVIVVTGTDIVRLLREKASRSYLSSQMATQIEIGLEIAEMARQELDENEKPRSAFNKLVRQCLGRDDGWKAFYVDQMAKVKPSGANKALLQLYEAEFKAEGQYMVGNYAGAASSLQNLIDAGTIGPDDKGWYLQEMARYNYRDNRTESQKLQLAAYNHNRHLLKPPSGATVAKLMMISQGRVDAIAEWVARFEDYDQLDVAVSDILSKLVFGTRAERFEQALHELGGALGFATERPDKEWKEGPDNLWALDVTNYILWECKSEVDIMRVEINKAEAEQMSRSAAWFEKHYPGAKPKRILIHPAATVASAAAFTFETEVMREAELKRLVKAVRGFFKSFESLNLGDLSATHIQKLINAHKLAVRDLLGAYTKKPKDLR